LVSIDFISSDFCMTAAYKHGDGKKIDGRRVLVDVERGRTVKGWLPRRLGLFDCITYCIVVCFSDTYFICFCHELGGGLGGTRKGAPDENVRHSGRDDGRSEERFVCSILCECFESN
jgi:U1 small nuclear ribonucleoprotein